MHTTHSNTQYKNESSTVKWAQWDKTQSRELLGLLICVCIALCTIVAHNIAQNRPDSFPPYPPDNHHISDVYLREGGRIPSVNMLFTYLFYFWWKYNVTVTFITMMRCDSICCMWSEAWSSRWLMTLMTSGQHACLLNAHVPANGGHF